jgi:tRNA(fMet)-specific endonuclease VapC
MKVYLLDTNIASALWDEGDEHHDDALEFARNAAASGDVLYVSRITIAEIEYGYELYTSKDPNRRRKAEANMRAFTRIKDIDENTTQPYAKIRAELYRQHAPKKPSGKIKNVRPERLIDKTTGADLGIQENDLWIAAIAVEYNMILVSDDRMQHIKDACPNLKIIKWKRPPAPPSTSTSIPPTTPPSSP